MNDEEAKNRKIVKQQHQNKHSGKHSSIVCMTNVCVVVFFSLVEKNSLHTRIGEIRFTPIQWHRHRENT